MKFTLTFLLFIGVLSAALAYPSRSERDVNDVMDAARMKYEELVKKAKEMIEQARAEGQKILKQIQAEDGVVKTGIRKLRARAFEFAAATLEMALKGIEMSKGPIDSMVNKLEAAIEAGLSMLRENIAEEGREDEETLVRMKRDFLPETIREPTVSTISEKLNQFVKLCQEVIEKMRARAEEVVRKMKEDKKNFAHQKLREFRHKAWTKMADLAQKTLDKIEQSEVQIEEKVKYLERSLAKFVSWCFKRVETEEREDETETRMKREILPEIIRDPIVEKTSETIVKLMNKIRGFVAKVEAKKDEILGRMRENPGNFATQKWREFRVEFLNFGIKTVNAMLAQVESSEEAVEKRVRELEAILRSGISWMFKKIDSIEAEEEPELYRMKRDILPEVFREKIVEFIGTNHGALVEKAVNLISQMQEKRDHILDKIQNDKASFIKQKFRQAKVYSWNQAIAQFEKAIEKISAGGSDIDAAVRKIEDYVEKAISWVFQKVEIEEGSKDESATFMEEFPAVDEQQRMKRDILPELFREKIVEFLGTNHQALVEKAVMLLTRMQDKRDAVIDRKNNQPGNFAIQKLRDAQIFGWNQAIEKFENAIESFSNRHEDIEDVVRKVEDYVEKAISWVFQKVDIEDQEESAAAQTFISFPVPL